MYTYLGSISISNREGQKKNEHQCVSVARAYIRVQNLTSNKKNYSSDSCRSGKNGNRFPIILKKMYIRPFSTTATPTQMAL